MFPDIRPGTTNNTAGWTCGVCGFFVGHGTTHYCAGAQPNPYPPFGYSVTVGGTNINQDDKIINKLDEIIRLLKRLVG